MEIFSGLSASCVHVFFGRETEGQDLCQSSGFIALVVHHVNQEILPAELPHHLAAHTAGREGSGDHPILAAADGDGRKVPVAVIDRLEEGRPLGTVGGAVSGIFIVRPCRMCPRFIVRENLQGWQMAVLPWG